MQEIEQQATEIDFKWPLGYSAGATKSGIKQNKLDLGWLVSEVPASAAGVYTTNQFQAAPTKLTKATISADQQLQAVILNSGNANSCTGKLGKQNALKEQNMIADKLNIAPDLVGVASTGIIGKQLPMAKIEQGIDALQLSDSIAVTEAVLTTDTHPKTIAVQLDLSGKQVTISGFCKGSGMIHPNMATMLGFVTTDASVDGDYLQQLLIDETNNTFNQITVDGDTSTNDMVVLMANGMAGNVEIDDSSSEKEKFALAIHQVLAYLAKQIAEDGEGASKLVEVNVKSAATELEAKQVAKEIVGSSLVKAMLFGEDANWGRIMDAIGKTDASLDVDHVNVWLNGIQLVKNSEPATFDLQPARDSLSEHEVVIDVDLHAGNSVGTAWGCDLTYKYVQINAAYE
ncbi:bifunctional ornithine acetyltransferase/N-acetylglutamate synthase [Lentilactobacillus curieae]|uniref:Arginine biosynthesis bifunctional protein ArgJ n=1 Tax=Lentilactobacillus curieae TaxID=1138822 RepID=A0A1S6QGZ9_9LACO|nr:bifunctional glutamate N-acetyltransferase/amino-acid acetyltransferase ArgJ [Lentilactobacillus curieae]AQW20884.1 bifunctional ornithine acetyltransferase/N-acetylglutamate synthase [Lentilactobacillus curieae]